MRTDFKLQQSLPTPKGGGIPEDLMRDGRAVDVGLRLAGRLLLLAVAFGLGQLLQRVIMGVQP
jgi:hypothetical protein